MKLLLLTVACALLTLVTVLGTQGSLPVISRPALPAFDSSRPAPKVARRPGRGAPDGRRAVSAPAKSAVPELPVAMAARTPETAPSEAVTDLSRIPPAGRAVARLRRTLEARLTDQLEPGESFPASLALSVHRTGLDPERLSDLDLEELYRRHRELQERLHDDLMKIRHVVDPLARVRPEQAEAGHAATERWQEFTLETDALASSYLR